MLDIRIDYIGSVDQLTIRDELETSIEASFEWLNQFLVFNGTIDIEVRIEDTHNGRFGGTGSVNNYLGQINGYDTWENDSVSESLTGIDADPATPEFIINIDPASDYLQKLWWDLTPLDLKSGEIPSDKTDAFSVVMHEILHGMGISGWLDWDSGEHTANSQSIWDSYISIQNGSAFFNGPHAIALLGQPVEVRLGGSQGAYHLGSAESQQPYLESSIMNSYHFFDGERYLPGPLEFAILEDLGWQLKPSAVPNGLRDVVGINNIENISYGTPYNDQLEGWESNDTLIGGSGDDAIDGGLGNDALIGNSGNDVLYLGFGLDSASGGEGRDSFNFYAPGHFIIQDFESAEDLLVFDSASTGMHSIRDLLSVIDRIEDSGNNVTLHFVNNIASIKLVGLNAGDLSVDMVSFA